MSGTDFPPPGGADHPPPPGAVDPTAPRPSQWGASPGWGAPAGWGTPSQTTAPSPGAHLAPAPGGQVSAPYPRAAPLAAHKPGAIPLRPLGLGDIYDAAFRIIRFNAKATAGPAVAVAAVAMAVPVLVSAVLAFAFDATFDLNATQTDAYGNPVGPTSSDVVGLVGPYAALLLGSILQAIGTIVVTGMIAHVVAAAAIGRKLTLGEVWAATRGKRWRLIGLAFLVSFIGIAGLGGYGALSALVLWQSSGGVVFLWFLLTLPALVVAWLVFLVRVSYFAPSALALEPIGVLASLKRAVTLSRQQFWRTFGILLLTAVISAVAGYMLTLPLSFVGQILGVGIQDGRYLIFIVVVTSAVGQVLSSAFTVPFQGAVSAVQYIDQRIRKEALDVELMTRAGIMPS